MVFGINRTQHFGELKVKLNGKRKKRRPYTVVGQHLTDYCLNTTLHGLKYVGLKELSMKERFFFGLSFFLVFGSSGYFINNIYVKWKENPMIIGMNAKLFNSKDFPFPAVTICNMNQAKESKVKSIKKLEISILTVLKVITYFSNLTRRNTLEHSVLNSICRSNSADFQVNSSTVGKWSFVKQFMIGVTSFLVVNDFSTHLI